MTQASAGQDPTADIPGTLRRAIGLLASDPATAEALARAVLATAPDRLEAQVVVASALRARGAFDQALAILEPIAAGEAASWVAEFELAQTLFALGRSREAVGPLTRALAANPGLTAGLRLLGDIALFSGRLPAAQSAYDRMLGSVIRDPRLQAPAEALAEGRLSAAKTALRAILAEDPAALGAAHLLGEALGREGRLADAETLLAHCVAQAPDAFLVRQSYAAALLRAGKPAEALAELDRLLAREPRDHRCRMIQAAALTEIGDYARAAEVTGALLEVFPDQPHGWLIHGHGLRTLGRINEAIAAYDRCLALDPDCTDALWSLANLKTYRFSDQARVAMAAQLARPSLGPHDRSNLHFTLGKADEDAGRYAEAFDHYVEGNAIEHARRAYDPERTSAFVRDTKALFSPAFFAERAGWGLAADDPIFIVGLPRSGSTLVDQILASHPAVEGARELHDIQVIADWIGLQDGGYPQALVDLTPEFAAKFGRDYLDWTCVRRRLGRPRFTDKAPWNFLHVGLIQLILPQAAIIDVRRHPLACCLSAFKQHFSQGWDFAYDLGDLGRYYADYVALMAHVDAVLPGRVHRVIYEDLVPDVEGQARRLLEHLRLPFDPACLRFFETDRAVATPSSEQVRQPIFTEALDQWRRFEPQLGPLKAALGPVLDAWPAAPAGW